jgi:ABC-type dipeptide/oligopeptide/nickel transport system permease component
MVQVLVSRGSRLIVTAFVAVTGIFFLLHILPGDPAVMLLGEQATAENMARLRAQLGLNEPLLWQYLHYLANVAQLNLGRSLLNGQALAGIIGMNLVYTVSLALSSLVIAVIVGIPAGVLMAVKRDRLADLGLRIGMLTVLATPSFVLALVLIMLLVVVLPIFPLTGAGDLGDAGSLLSHGILPALALGLPESAALARVARSEMLEALGGDFVRTARAKGLLSRQVLFRHCVRNILLPVVTLAGLSLTRALAGAAIIETIFSRPGIGSLFLTSVNSRDYTETQSTLVVFALLIVVVNIVIDFSYAVIDPRLRRA